MSKTTTWKNLITDAMQSNYDSFDNVVAHTFKDSEIDVEFYDGFGGSSGIPFTLWTKTRVYFPVVYDGAEWVGSAARNPDGIPTPHHGGE